MAQHSQSGTVWGSRRRLWERYVSGELRLWNGRPAWSVPRTTNAETKCPSCGDMLVFHYMVGTEDAESLIGVFLCPPPSATEAEIAQTKKLGEVWLAERMPLAAKKITGSVSIRREYAKRLEQPEMYQPSPAQVEFVMRTGRKPPPKWFDEEEEAPRVKLTPKPKPAPKTAPGIVPIAHTRVFSADEE